MKPAAKDNQQEAMMSNIVGEAQKYVLELFNKASDSRLLYHNYQRTSEIADQVKILATTIGSSTEDQEIALLATWFHAVGYLKDADRAVDHSTQMAESFLKSKSYSDRKGKAVLTAISASGGESSVESPAVQLMMDAINGFNATANFFDHRPLLRLQWELTQKRKLTGLEWNQIQLQSLMQTHFYTDFGKKQYEPILAQNILTQQAKVEKSKRNKFQLIEENEGQTRKFQGLEKRLPSSATQTFFRTNYRNHINLSAIADNKANIMISVNAILISVIISVLSYRNISETNPMVLLPVVLFLVTALTSLICAVLSIRPKITALNDGAFNAAEAKKNIVFFGNFVNMTLEQYEEAVDSVLRDGELLYGNMTRDLYFLGKVLDKKYRFLTMSYNIFMIGFIATVISFLAVVFS